MLKLVSPQNAPIGGFRFQDPDTGVRFEGSNFADLEFRVQSHREKNNLPRITKFRAVWEHYVCENVPGMRGQCCSVQEHVKRRFEQYWAGGKAYIKAVLQGKNSFVDQITANRRSAICADCTQNVVNIGHSHSQFYTDKFIQAHVGPRRSAKHNDLHTCKICTCILKSKVWFNEAIVAESLSDREIAQLTTMPRDTAGRHLKCWQIEALNNHLAKESNDDSGE